MGIIIAVCLAVALVFIFSRNRAGVSGNIRSISPDQAREMIQAGAVLLDVRTEQEFFSGHISGAKLIPVGEIRLKVSGEIPDKSQTVIVYCASGGRSAAAARQLSGMGYTSIYDMGGINRWPYGIVQE